MKNKKKCCCLSEKIECISNGNKELTVEKNDAVRREKLIKIYKDLFDIEINEENENISFKKLGIDSMQVVTILVEIQDRIGYDFYDSGADLMKLRTFNDLIRVMEQC